MMSYHKSFVQGNIMTVTFCFHDAWTKMSSRESFVFGCHDGCIQFSLCVDQDVWSWILRAQVGIMMVAFRLFPETAQQTSVIRHRPQFAWVPAIYRKTWTLTLFFSALYWPWDEEETASRNTHVIQYFRNQLKMWKEVAYLSLLESGKLRPWYVRE